MSIAPAIDVPALAQLSGQRARLQRELAHAFSAQPLPNPMIDRIISDLARIDGALAGNRWQRSHERAIRGAGGQSSPK